MTIQVTMSKEEFLSWNSFQEFKSKIKCGIIDLNNSYNTLFKQMLEDGILEDKNKYDKIMKEFAKNITALEGDENNDNSKS